MVGKFDLDEGFGLRVVYRGELRIAASSSRVEGKLLPRRIYFPSGQRYPTKLSQPEELGVKHQSFEEPVGNYLGSAREWITWAIGGADADR